RAQGGFSTLTLDAAAQLDDLSLEFLVRGYFHHQPFKTNRLVGEDRTSEAHPEFEADHGAVFGIVRRRQPKEERRCMRPARDETSVASGGCELRVMMDRIVITRGPGVRRDQRGSERDFNRETFSRISLHNSPPFTYDI